MKVPPLRIALLGLALAGPLPALACPMCRDTTAGSTPQARKALRLAIPLLGMPAVGIFAGGFVLASRFRPGGKSE